MHPPLRHATLGGALPPLAFGNRGKLTFTGPHEFGDSLRRAGYSLLEVDAASRNDVLKAQTACITLPSVTLFAVSSAAQHVVGSERDGRVSLCFGVHGLGTFATLERVQRTASYHRSTGVFIPGGPVVWRVDDHASHIELSLDREQLQKTARTMLGLDQSADLGRLDLDEVRQIAPRQGVVDGRWAITSLALQADGYSTQPSVFALSGIEDQFLRYAVLMLMPEAFRRPWTASTLLAGEPPVVERLCEWIRAHLGSTITLTDMECISGLSARALQLGFQKRYAMTPMEWLREQRLLAARDLLSTAASLDRMTTVADVARQTGFGSPQLLHRWYRARFGETPGETLRGRAV